MGEAACHATYNQSQGNTNTTATNHKATRDHMTRKAHSARGGGGRVGGFYSTVIRHHDDREDS